MADNGTVGRVQTMYVKGTSERVKKLGDEVAAALKKPKGQLTKDELKKALDSTDKLRNANPPLNNVEELNRLSMHQALIVRGAGEKLMTLDEIAARKDTMRFAMGAPGGGGAGSIRKGGGTGPMLPKTGAATGQNPLPAGGGGVAVVARPRYGPFHRLVGKEEIELVKKSGQIRGGPARNTMPSPFPSVKAFEGPLPAGRSGYEFYTTTPPYQGGVPGKPLWYGPVNEPFHSIPVDISKINTGS
jgi:hypothetical protein